MRPSFFIRKTRCGSCIGPENFGKNSISINEDPVAEGIWDPRILVNGLRRVAVWKPLTWYVLKKRNLKNEDPQCGGVYGSRKKQL